MKDNKKNNRKTERGYRSSGSGNSSGRSGSSGSGNSSGRSGSSVSGRSSGRSRSSVSGRSSGRSGSFGSGKSSGRASSFGRSRSYAGAGSRYVEPKYDPGNRSQGAKSSQDKDSGRGRDQNARKKAGSGANTSGKARLLPLFVGFCVLMTLLCGVVGYRMIIQADDLASKALENQVKDSTVNAKRGSIFDRNGNELATSGTTYSVWVRPANISSASKKAKKEEEINNAAYVLADILEMDKDEVKKLITKKQTLVKIAKYVDKEKVDKIREAELQGIETSEEAKRYYIAGDLASRTLGSVTDDNKGLSGIEMYYNDFLAGLNGRSLSKTDPQGNQLARGGRDYYDAKDGDNLVLTLDVTIQEYAKEAAEKVKKKTKSDRVMIMAMDPETGEILAMTTTPGYDANDPWSPLEKDKEKFDKMSEKKQLKYLNEMWRNPLISDTYEPGSTFKLLTTSIALEEGVVTPDDTFRCGSSINVNGTTIRCWNFPEDHGVQTVKEAVGNSCNPVLVQIGSKVGVETMYEYFDLFGITGTTGVDFPGEATSILQNKDDVGPVELATISFGQGVAVTPVGLLTAVCAIGNDGNLMKPHVLKEIKDKNGKTKEKIEPEIVRKVISKKTASQMCKIMQYVVDDGGAKTAAVEGYTIGGKTGTANKAKKGGYSNETFSSFIGMAPMEDPQIAVLVIADNPKGIKYGSATAAPGAQQFFKNVLRYLGIEKTNDKKVDPMFAGESDDDVEGADGEQTDETAQDQNEVTQDGQDQSGETAQDASQTQDASQDGSQNASQDGSGGQQDATQETPQDTSQEATQDTTGQGTGQDASQGGTQEVPADGGTGTGQ